jgi:hypothetical protein
VLHGISNQEYLEPPGEDDFGEYGPHYNPSADVMPLFSQRRNLGKKEMKVDTAVMVCHQISQLNKPLESLQFVDNPVIAVDESVTRFLDTVSLDHIILNLTAAKDELLGDNSKFVEAVSKPESGETVQKSEIIQMPLRYLLDDCQYAIIQDGKPLSKDDKYPCLPIGMLALWKKQTSEDCPELF